MQEQQWNSYYGIKDNGDRNLEVWKGIAAGVVGGILGSWAMLQFQKTSSKLLQGDISRNLKANIPEHREKREAEFSSNRGTRAAAQHRQKDDATMKLAGSISEKVFNFPLSQDERKMAGSALHFAFGAGMGALYGGVVEMFPAARVGFGIPFVTLLFLVADQIVVPALGLAPHPKRRSLKKHAYGFFTHVVSGLALEAFRRGTRNDRGTVAGFGELAKAS